MGDLSSTDWDDSKIICNCTHLESEHIGRGGCIKCRCDRYDQTKLLKLNSEAYLDHFLKNSLKD